jgi:Dna[CI] antecedent, DciA
MDRISGRSLATRLFGASPARTLALLQAVWPQVVGPELARRTEVVGVEGGTLRVRVPDASWRKVLHRMQPQILGRLHEMTGDLAPRRMGFLESNPSNQPQSAAAPPVGGADARGLGTDRAQSVAAPRSGGDTRGGFQGGSSLRSECAVSSPPEIEDVAATIEDEEIRARFVMTMARYLERSKGKTDA